MKFLITWQLHDDKIHDTLALFSQMTEDQEAALMGDDMRLIGRWHDLVRGSGAAIYESDSAEAISKYSLAWNKHMDLDISVVVDDAEAKAIGKKAAGN